MRASLLPTSPSRSVLTIGMPPATAASKLSATWLRSARAASFTPCLASSALFAVTTDLPFASAVSTARPADQFDEHVDPRIARERDRIADPADFLEVDAAVFRLATGGDRDDFDSA